MRSKSVRLVFTGLTVCYSFQLFLLFLNSVHNIESNIIIKPGPIVMQFKSCCFELKLRNAELIQPSGRKEFLSSLWGRCEPRIARNLGSYWFVAAIWIYKAKHGWGFELLITPHSETGCVIVQLCLRSIGLETSSRLAVLTIDG